MALENLIIINKTKGTLPRVPFADIKNAVLGKDYELSVVFVGNTRSRNLNRTYRNKDKPTNVLSFSVNKNEGEIFINPHKAKSEMKKFDRTFAKMIGFLFIHGLLHLKGMEHGSKMEHEEQKFCTRFGI